MTGCLLFHSPLLFSIIHTVGSQKGEKVLLKKIHFALILSWRGDKFDHVTFVFAEMEMATWRREGLDFKRGERAWILSFESKRRHTSLFRLWNFSLSKLVQVFMMKFLFLFLCMPKMDFSWYIVIERWTCSTKKYIEVSGRTSHATSVHRWEQ